ncbi:leucine-rich repeat-containing protein 1-like [Ylistrum balloti]|uniref:leucine-rich repeat-containing protein 1-like n=1 Tax=Ylistrum balloti TaxID=509963 RepID=UPI002905EA7B|nr:leucine-rich repeat-containing protein 1-like [Ylistrum balloti]
MATHGLLMIIDTNGSFVPDDPRPCPVKTPCKCSFNEIECSNLTQTEFPSFTKVNASWNCWSLVMNNNFNIKRIPAGAFDNVPFCNLRISHNGFEIMEDGALNGSEPYLGTIFMQFNKFKELPNEIARMPNLTMLSINDNPIETLPQKMAFSSTLRFLDVGSPEMTTWPDSIRTLKSVWSLTLYNLPMSDLPSDAFEGLENAVSLLTFTSTKFKAFPKALKRLKTTTGLSITDNIELKSEGIPDDALSGMDSLGVIFISNSSLTRVPNISTNPFLTYLTITNSPLSTWDVTTLPKQPLIQSIDFSNTDIDRIPVPVRHIRSLNTLTMHNTKVTNIGQGDLAGLQKLRELSLDKTPLANISMDAFNDTYSLQYLNIDFTKLPGFPRAIERLPALRAVGLDNIPIECSCSELGWMKHWIGLQQFLDGGGQCHNIHKYFTDYIREDIPKCP